METELFLQADWTASIRLIRFNKLPDRRNRLFGPVAAVTHVKDYGRKGSGYGPREQGAYLRVFHTIVKTAYTCPG